MATVLFADAVATVLTLIVASVLVPSFVSPSAYLQNYTFDEWLGSRVVSVLDTGAEGPGFKSHS